MKCVRSDYFFFRAFFAFFAFLFFAIAALLSHGMWRCRNSAVADRRALHSNYTSATEKTLTPFHGAGTRAQTPSAIARMMTRNAVANAANSRAVSSKAKQDFDSAKTHIPSAFSRISSMRKLLSRAAKNLNHPQLMRNANRDAVSVLHWSKKFFHRWPFRGIASTVNRSKTSESVRKLIRSAGPTSGVEASNDAYERRHRPAIG